MKLHKLIPLLLLAFLLSSCTNNKAPEPETEDTPPLQTQEETPDTSTMPEEESPLPPNDADPIEAVEWDADSLVAVTYLGYAETLGDAQLNNNLKTWASQYDTLSRVTSASLVELPGTEVYYLLPRHADATITIFDTSLNDEGELVVGQSIYEGGPEPILLLCNVSDLFPNCTITVTGGGQEITFSPFISLQDGSLMLPEMGAQNATPDIDFSAAVG